MLPGFEMQLMIVSLVTLHEIFMKSRMLNDGICLLFSRAVIMHLTDKTLYFNFSD